MPQAPVDWDRVDTVLLDMDGTLLDLNFDNRFWIELLPARWGEARGMTYEEAFKELYPLFKAREGTLEWYSTTFWQQELGLGIVEMKSELAHLVQVLPGAEDFLKAVRESGRRLVLVTNAHDDTLEFKLARIEIGRYFDAMYTSHQFGIPKEGKGFWERVQAVEPFDRSRALFADDSLRVLENARDYGIAQLVCMRQPDSTQPARDVTEYPAVISLRDIMPNH
ncbi:MAG TPA: GMP/IMP nucleotidase [Gammaproteobacteria bacterium]